MTRYVIADSPAAAERVMALIPHVAFPRLAQAIAQLAGYPKPCRYRVLEVHHDGQSWKAYEVEE